MTARSASNWIEEHWSPDELPNNEWIAASPVGIVAHNASLDEVIQEVQNSYKLDELAFAYASFDLWQ